MTTITKILDTAESLFRRYGIRSITMDDIAKELAISKKTIYQLFKDKNEMVRKVTERLISKEVEEMEQIAQNSANAVEAVMKLADYVKQCHIDMNPAFIYDTEKYHADSWTLHQEHIENHIFGYIKSNLQRGVEEGLYREECNYDILARIQIAQIALVFNGNIFPKECNYSLVEIQLELIDHFIRGIVTQKGFAIFEKYTNETKTLSHR